MQFSMEYYAGVRCIMAQLKDIRVKDPLEIR